MNPIWGCPVLVCIFVIIWKGVDAVRLPNLEKQLSIMGIYIGSVLVLYWLSYRLWLGIFERLVGASWISGHTLVVHLAIIVSFISSFLFLVYRVKRTVKRVGPPTIEKISKQANNTARTVERVAERSSDTNERVTEYREECQEKYEEVRRDVEERYEKENKRIDSLDGVIGDHEATMKDNAEKMRRIGNQMEEQAEVVEDLKDEVESLRGKRGEEEGLDYQNELGKWFTRLGYEAEVNERSGADIVVRKPQTREPILVVGAKAYKLRSRRGLSNKFDPEIKFAGAEGVPLVTAVKNKLTDLEMFRMYEPEELEDFTCSAPSWLVGEKPTNEGREKESGCRRELRDLLFRELEE